MKPLSMKVKMPSKQWCTWISLIESSYHGCFPNDYDWNDGEELEEDVDSIDGGVVHKMEVQDIEKEKVMSKGEESPHQTKSSKLYWCGFWTVDGL